MAISPASVPDRAAARTSRKAVTALILGIVAVAPGFVLVCPAFVLGPMAVVFGLTALRDPGPAHLRGRGRAWTGIVLGLLSVVLGAIWGTAICLAIWRFANEVIMID